MNLISNWKKGKARMERNLALEVVRATEAAALAAARFIGKGDDRMADRAACDAMRKTLNSVAMDGKIVIGEGSNDDTDCLYEGEIVGTGAGTGIDVALDAIEGSLICATGGPNALSCVALTERGRILRCPDTYMDKVACGPAGRGVIDIDKSPTDNLKALAESKRVYVEDLRVAILDRPRHEKLINEVRKAGAGIKMISAGDLSAAIATTRPESEIDMLIGIGGAHQGVAGRCCDSLGRRRDAMSIHAAQRRGSRSLPRDVNHRYQASLHAGGVGGRVRHVRGDGGDHRRVLARGAIFFGRWRDD